MKRLEDDLLRFKKKAYPFATKDTLNRAAFFAQDAARKIIDKKMIERNKFTRQSIRVNKATGLNIPRQHAIVGSTASYMEDQEFGGIKRTGGKEGVALSTSWSAGQGLNTQPRTRLARKPNKLRNIILKKRRRKGANRKQSNLIAIKQAASSGSKYV